MATNVSSLKFNGTNRHAKLSANATTKNMTNFTWMAWVKVGPLTTSSLQRVYVERQGVSTGIRFAVAPFKGKLRFEFSPKDGVADTNYDVKYDWDDRWHHIAFVARITGSNPTYTIYLDATKVATGTLVKPSGTDQVTNTAPFGSVIYLGNHSMHTSGGDVFASDRYFDGNIDEILLFSTAKNDSDILTYFTSHDVWDMGDVDMFSYWRFDENTGNSTTDSDNGAWTGTTYVSNVASTALWTVDRPFLGNGTLDTTAPTVPGSPSTTSITADGFTANWTASTDAVFVQGYELDVATVSDFSSYTPYILGVTGTKTTVGLLPGTNYYWRVRAFDAASNQGSFTATQSLTTLGSGDVTAPVPPTALNASSVLYSSFSVNYTASVSSDETGYKIDVALDPYFVSYVSGFRNKDIGNVVTTAVTGVAPLTTYYVRLRAYDAAGNESVESTTLTVQTPSAPDLIAPDEISLENGSSIVSHAFTANWEEGVDNVGVVSYEIDVSTDPAFGSFVLTALNVGNVLSYRVTGVNAATTYYYRVRGKDTAGNVSQNPLAGMAVTTTPISIEDGGFITTIVEPLGDAWNDSTATTTNHGTDTTLEVLGSGAANTRSTYLQFDLGNVVGTIQSATLWLYVTNASAANIVVSADNVLFTESTINWSNQPALAGATLNFVPSTINAWVSVDISSLLLDGATVYAVKLTTISTDNAIFHSRENTNKPYIELEHDPSTATDIQSLDLVDLAGVVTNYTPNPGFEVNTTNWSIVGAGTVISRVTAQFHSGVAALQIVTNSGVASQGAQVTPVSTAIPSIQNDTWTLTFWAKASTGTPLVVPRIYGYSGAGALLDQSPASTVTLSTAWKRFSVTFKVTNASTAAVTPIIYGNGTQTITFFIDDVSMVKLPHSPLDFDGNTSGAKWTGTANNSTSSIDAAAIVSTSTYIGDADSDNSVDMYVKRSTDVDWIRLPALTSAVSINRSTKTVTGTVYGSYGPYNLVRNPSFEVDTASWTALQPAGTSVISRDIDTADEGLASLKIVTSANSGNGAFSNAVPAISGDTFGARVRIQAPINYHAKLLIQALDAASAVLSSSAVTYGVNALIGDGTWQDLITTHTMPASTAFVRIAVLTDAADAGTMYIDKAMLNVGLVNNPYRDGSYEDARWEATAHDSYSSLLILPDRSYDVLHHYTDPDGLYDNLGQTTADITQTYTTALVPDNVTTTGTLTLTPVTVHEFEGSDAHTEGIEVSATYSGDDNNNMTALVEYRRTDLTNWTAVAAAIDRAANVVSATIVHLKHGTSYTVRVTFTDTDGVFGGSVLTGTTTTITEHDAVVGASRILFGGFVLFDSNNESAAYGVTSHDAFGLPERRVQINELPLVDGAIELSNVWGKREIQMEGFVGGDTREALEDNKNALKKALAPRLQHLVIDTLGLNSRYFVATCEQFDCPQGKGNYTHLPWTARFVCADPFSYETSATVMPEASFGNNATFTVDNLGDLRADLYLKIRTSHTSAVTLTITNTTTGERITPQATIKNGDRMVIDTTRLSLLKNGIETSYSGGFIHLNPFGNTFTINVSAPSGTPTVLIEMQWRHRFL